MGNCVTLPKTLHPNMLESLYEAKMSEVLFLAGKNGRRHWQKS